MAISQIRLKINGTWHTLTYNSSTQRYEGALSLSASSYGQAGGYYDATVEATNSGGTVVTKSGADMASLRLVVKDAAAPSISLESPAQGYLLTKTPTFSIAVTDLNPGVDVNSIAVKLDGAAVTPTRTAITNGYRLTYSPTLSDGAHTLTVSAADLDGNASSASFAWTVDTAGPVLDVSSPTAGQFVTNPSLTVRGTVSDATSGVQSVTVNGTAVAVSNGSFAHTLTLAEGSSAVTVTAKDKAGNNLVTTYGLPSMEIINKAWEIM